MIKKWITENTLHTGIFCFIAILVSFAVYNLTHVLLSYCAVEARLAESIGRLLGSIVIILFYKKILNLKSFGMKKENLFRGILTGILMLFIIIGNVPIAINDLSEYSMIMPSLYLIIMVIIEQIFVGIFEEFLFRGLILNILLEKTEHLQYKGMTWSLFISSVLFGATHILNLFDNPEEINSTIAQTVGSIFIGVFLGALYLRCRNIWVVVFYHTLIDIATDLPVIFYDIPASTGGSSDMPFSDVIPNILANSIVLFIGLFLARRSKSKYAEQSKTSK